MAAFDITDQKAIEIWLQEQKAEVAIALAARVALRVLPLMWLVRSHTEKDLTQNVIFPGFRAAAFAWAVAKYQSQAHAIIAHNADTVDAASQAAFSSGFVAAIADSADSGSASAASAAADVVVYTAAAARDPNDAGHVADGITRAITAAAFFPGIYVAIRSDIEAIEAGRSGKQLLNRRLWPRQYTEIAAMWAEMKAHLLANPSEHFEVWTDWYEARLAGRRTNDALEIARVTISNDILRDHYTVVNAELKRLIAFHIPVDAGSVKKALQQRPAAFAFRVSDNKVDAVPEDAKPHDRDTTDDLYDEAKRKALALHDRLRSIQADDHLRANVDRLIARLGDAAADLRPGLILSALRALLADVRAWDTEEGRRELSFADLSRLVDLAETTRDLAASFPKAREIEAEALALDVLSEIDEVQDRVSEIACSIDVSDGATKPAKAAIVETMAGIWSARTVADRAKQLSYALLDIGNFARAGLSYVKTTGGELVPPLGMAARTASRELSGLGKDSWKSIRKGFPKGVETGARTVGRATIVGGATALMAHIVGPIAALGTLISSFASLGKIAEDLSEKVDAADRLGSGNSDQ